MHWEGGKGAGRPVLVLSLAVLSENSGPETPPESAVLALNGPVLPGLLEGADQCPGGSGCGNAPEARALGDGPLAFGEDESSVLTVQADGWAPPQAPLEEHERPPFGRSCTAGGLAGRGGAGSASPTPGWESRPRDSAVLAPSAPVSVPAKWGYCVVLGSWVPARMKEERSSLRGLTYNKGQKVT